MAGDRPGLLKMMRAKFLFAIIVPITISTSLAVSIQGNFDVIGFFLALFMGLSLHISTNVYNDIYDTKQGSDTSKSSENEFSGGSGVLIEDPDLERDMFSLARAGLVLGLIAAIGLLFTSRTELWPLIIIIYILSVFFSKYYTAGPVKFAYRGLGEIVVWIGFGPLAVLLGGVGQNVVFHPYMISIMPITGLTTLFIVWMGEMVDLPGDLKAGKKGLVSRLGLRRGMYGHLSIHVLALLNLSFVAFLIGPVTILWVAIFPHIVLLPIIYRKFSDGLNEPKVIRDVSKLNFSLYFLFSISLMVGFILHIFI